MNLPAAETAGYLLPPPFEGRETGTPRGKTTGNDQFNAESRLGAFTKEFAGKVT
jgi:hypothetical protein